MTTGAVAAVNLPCGCPVEGSLFDTADGTRVLITNRRYEHVAPTVWCVEEIRWVGLTDAEYETLRKVRM